MAKKETIKPRASNTMTEAQYISFVKSALRSASRRWRPIYETLRKARVERGKYLCNGCGGIVPPTLNKKKNIAIDHIIPIIDPKTGFIDWNNFISLLFCEEDNLQVLCKSCHDIKSKREREVYNETRKNKNNVKFQ